MTRLAGVIWKEGMHLSQHHFQVQRRYFESSMHFALSHLAFAPFGIGAVGLDVDALRNGTVRLVHARGILPDGSAFLIADGDAGPAPLALGERFSPVRDGHVVLLALPAYRSDGANCAPDGRYAPEQVAVLDEIFGRDERPVLVGRQNHRLLLDTEYEAAALDAPPGGAGWVTLPVARIRRDGAGGYVYDDTFVPPSLTIGASAHLMLLLRRLVDVLGAKRDALAAERGPGSAPGELGPGETSAFWLAHTVNASLPSLRHLLTVRHVHPERLYVELARLAGALCTFALDAHPDSLPPYEHERLGECFDALDRHIRAHLELVRPTRAIRIALEQRAPHLHVGQITDGRALGRGRWLLGVRADVPSGALLERVPRLVKVCSGRFVIELVNRAMPGMALAHVPAPPPAAAPRAGLQYFALDPASPYWRHVQSTSEVGVYVPDELPAVELDLVMLPS